MKKTNCFVILLGVFTFYSCTNNGDKSEKDLKKFGYEINELSTSQKEIFINELLKSIEKDVLELDTSINEHGKTISKKDADTMVSNFKDKINKAIGINNKALIFWPRNTKGWLINADLIDSLIHQSGPKVDELLVEMAIKPDPSKNDSKLFTLVITGVNTKPGPGKVYFKKKDKNMKDQEYAIEYVGGCNNCP